MNISDTIPLYEQIPYPELTFYDSTAIVFQFDGETTVLFPHTMIEHNRMSDRETSTQLIEHLRDGKEAANEVFHEDWLLLVLIFSAFVYAVMRAFFGKVSGEFSKLVSLKRPVSFTSDISSLFHGNAAVVYFVSFLNIALFLYCVGIYFDLIPPNLDGPLFLLIALSVVATAVFSRHLISVVVGRISGQNRLFNDYIVSVYNSYTFIAYILFFLSILILYTTIISVKYLFFIAFGVIAIVFLIRYLRLYYSFTKSNISILYLILYLCALEILPVAVIVKYIQGLI